MLEKLLIDKEYDDKFTICKNHSLTDKIKNDCKEEKNAERPQYDKE